MGRDCEFYWQIFYNADAAQRERLTEFLRTVDEWNDWKTEDIDDDEYHYSILNEQTEGGIEHYLKQTLKILKFLDANGYDFYCEPTQGYAADGDFGQYHFDKQRMLLIDESVSHRQECLYRAAEIHDIKAGTNRSIRYSQSLFVKKEELENPAYFATAFKEHEFQHWECVPFGFGNLLIFSDSPIIEAAEEMRQIAMLLMRYKVETD